MEAVHYIITAIIIDYSDKDKKTQASKIISKFPGMGYEDFF